MPSDIRNFFSPPQSDEKKLNNSVSSPDEIRPVGIKRKLELSSSENEDSPKLCNNNKHYKSANGVAVEDGKEQVNGAGETDSSLKHNGVEKRAKNGVEKDCEEKEKLLEDFRKMMPEVDILQAQQLLSRNNWDLEKAKKAAGTPTKSESDNSSDRTYDSIEKYEKDKNEMEKKKHHHHHKSSSSTSHHSHHHHSSSHSSKHKSSHKSPSSSKSSSTSPSPSKSGHHHHHHKRRSGDKEHKSEKRKSDEHNHKSPEKRRSDEHNHKSKHRHKNKTSKSDQVSEDENDISNTAVYDSDADSDDGTNYIITKDRTTVLNFLNEATQTELIGIKSCSVKKADLIREMRPFESWPALVKQMSSSKMLSYDLLNNCQDWLRRRNKVTKLLSKCNKIIQSLQKAIERGKDAQVEQPSLLSTELKLADYQLIGLNWLIMMHKEKFNGILADEMGLGKTVQIISFLAYLKEKNLSSEPHLIIVPASTMDNWENEMTRWCPKLNIVKYYGALEERKQLRISFSKGGLDGIDVILTTYNTVIAQPEERKMFRTIKIDYVIFDEGHMLKNMTTIRYEQLNRINANRRILLTGTPLQNNLLELMSLLNFTMPDLFSSSAEEFKTLFQKVYKPVKTDENDANKSETTTFFEQSQIEKAKQVMKPFVLRRLKKDVLQSLPPKTTSVINVKMSESQRQRYTELVQYYSNEDNVVKSSSENNGLSIMMEMRKLTNHPLLMRYFFTDEKCEEIAKRLATDMIYKKTNADHIFEELVVMSDYQIYQLAQKYPATKNYKIPQKIILDSGKFDELDTLLPQLKKEGHRALIFSQFTMMLDILEEYLEMKKYAYLRLDGSTTVTERQDMIDEYNHAGSEYFIFLLSTKAGGLGINLTSADTVIIHDIDFNPYNDKQAEDRCHRLGQKKPVHIYKLITEQSIEEGMYAVTQDKLNLERDVTNQGEEENNQQDHKCMVKLLTTALGFDKKKAENLLSPQQQKKKPKA